MLKSRKGFSLSELLIAVVILGILSSIVLVSGNSAQKKARISASLSLLDDYESAFSTVCLNHPGVMKDREEAWKAVANPPDDYSSEQGLARLVAEMNTVLEPSAQLYWDGTYKCYRSYGEDPWGGFFILTEFPTKSDHSDTGFDPTTGLGVGAMRCSIWATGNDDHLLTDKEISKDSVGVAFVYQGGYVTTQYNGVESDSRPFEGDLLALQ